MFEKQYKETFSQVVASDSLMQEVLNLKNKRNKKIRVTTLLAAVILLFALATTAFGEVDAIILTGGVCHSKVITGQITDRVKFIAPVIVYPGEDELESLAENGYGILSGEFEIKEYHRDYIID